MPHALLLRLARSSSFAFVLGTCVLGPGCGDDATNDAPDETWLSADAPLVLTASASPVAGLDADVDYYGGIAYGTDPEQVFDAFLPESVAPTPAIIFIHGGGFKGGKRSDAFDTGEIPETLDAGVAFLTLDYRLFESIGVEDVGVEKCLHDSRRALQFIRFHAEELNLDPTRIAVYGSSAGAGTSVWIGFHDDMAQPGNPDLVARESTRVRAVGAQQTQATYDVLRWAPDVFKPQYSIVSNDLLLQIDSALSLLVQFYGLPLESKEDPEALLDSLYEDAWVRTRADLDMLGLASADDPPIYLVTTTADVSPLADGFDLLHHPLHAKTLYEASVAAGIVSVEADIPAYDLASDYDTIDFLLDRL